MMHHYLIIAGDREMLAARDRRAALVRASELRRLMRLTRTARPRHTLLRSRALDLLGARLVAWGWRLRERYGNLDAVEYRRREA